MKLHGINLVSSATAAIMFLSAQPAWAESTQITEVQLKPVDSGMSLVLKTNSGSSPQIFTTKRGKDLVADIINTQLRLSEGKSFRQDNPAPGIASVAINQLDANSVRVVITGSNDAPSNQPVERKQNGITLNFTPTGGMAGRMPTPQDNKQVSQANVPIPPQNQIIPPTPPGQKPSVLVPNPQVTIDGKPAPAAGLIQPNISAPPFLPRAVAPPVGDIAVSNLDASPSNVDLGTQERVPRLVLRDAPVREVLSLLARAANLNLAYIGGGAAAQPGATAASGGDGPTISLDIENEPVQDVFNYVLRLSGLEANRNGRTIFVGAKLPSSTRDTVMRSLRLNQVTVGVAINFLVSLGAESAVSRERQVTSVNAVPVGNAAAPLTQSQTTTETRVETQRIDFQDSKPLLRGLQALGEERTNSITLIGTPRLVDIAVAQLTQLDIRRRQVVVNVKIIDVNLSGSQDFNSSFSFAIGNNYFSNDGGAATLNFGGSRPATGTEVRNSVTGTPIITNPYSSSAPFFDPNSSVNIPGTSPGTTVVNSDGSTTRTQNSGSASFYKPISPTGNGNPLQAGFTNITPAKDNIVTFDSTGKATVAQGSLGTATAALPSLYQFPKKLLTSLQAQVQNGNAKILTDPTLIVQEGQQALVNLTQEVVGNVKLLITDNSGGSRTEKQIEKQRVGLTLNVKIDRIDDNGFVSLSVAPTVSSPAASQETGNGQIVLVSERSLTSGLIRLRDGQTLILSGIIQDSDRTTVSKIPILGDIPLLGSLFRSSSKTNERREVIVLLTPQIMDDSERSSYGYNYNPSPEVRQMLERRGLQVPKR